MAAAPVSHASAARLFLQHFGRPDSSGVLPLLSPSIVYRVPGRSVLAGTFHGPAEVATHLAKIVELTGGTMTPVKIEDLMEGEQHVAVIVVAHAQGGGRSYHGTQLFLFNFDMDDLIADIIVFPCDEAAIERFFGP